MLTQSTELSKSALFGMAELLDMVELSRMTELLELSNGLSELRCQVAQANLALE